MSLTHIIAQPVVERRGVVVRPLGEWPTEDAPERQCDLVKAACRDLRHGITSTIISMHVGVRVEVASAYLCGLAKRGVLVVERVLPAAMNGGRRTKVYRVAP